jgi:AraC family ethanolamine operon transcriptional activator
VDGYQRSVAGVHVEATRLGVGTGPNTVASFVEGSVIATSSSIGFPIAVRSTVPDDRLVIACMRSVAPGSRWTGIDLRPGMVLAYAPGAEHLAINKPGVSFVFTVIEAERLGARAEQLRIPGGVMERGAVEDASHRPGAEAVSQALLDIPSLPDRRALARLGDDLLSSLAIMSAGAVNQARRGPARRVDGRRTVLRCLDYVEALGRRPTISELCAVAGVSERRLREAFVSTFDIPPMAYFRDRALDEAYRLLSSEASVDNVTSVATGLGFTHFGRFGQYYARVHGELPSETLKAHRPSPVPHDDASRHRS